MKLARLLLVCTLLFVAVFLTAQVRENITMESEMLRALGSVRDILVEGNIAYVSGTQAVLMAFDVSDPAQPLLLSLAYYPDALPSHAYIQGFGKLIKTGGYLYFSIESAMVAVFDVADPFAITYVSEVSGLNGFSGNHVQDGNRLYLLNAYNLNVWNLSSPLTPQLMGSYTMPGIVVAFQAAGDHAFVSYSTGVENGFQLSVLNVSNPQNITQISLQPGLAQSMLIYSNLLYMADLSSGINILDISNPQAPIQVGLVTLPNGISWRGIDWVIDGTWLYARFDPFIIDFTEAATYMRYDLANPLAPVPLDEVYAGYEYHACFDV